MARLARKQMADMRALEEEAERMNPITGSGATPSMGLSQFRGGAKKKMLGQTLNKRIAKMEKAEPSAAEAAEVEEADMPSGEYDGAGKHSEPAHQGRMLGQHLHKLHGGAYVKEFMSGMGMCGAGELTIKHGGLQTGAYEGEGKAKPEMEGGFWGALASLAAPLIGSLFGKGEMKKTAHNALMRHFNKKPRSKKAELQGGFFGALLSAAVPLIGSLFGKGAMSKKAHDEMMAFVKKHEKKGGMKGAGRMVGAGELTIKHEGMDSESEGEMESPKAPAKKKRVVSEGDGRRKRAEVVRRVMKEKGMKMIEASKYVKEHGLY